MDGDDVDRLEPDGSTPESPCGSSASSISSAGARSLSCGHVSMPNSFIVIFGLRMVSSVFASLGGDGNALPDGVDEVGRIGKMNLPKETPT